MDLLSDVGDRHCADALPMGSPKSVRPLVWPVKENMEGNACHRIGELWQSLLVGLAHPREEGTVSRRAISAATSSSALIESRRIEGARVYDPDGRRIGAIDHLVIEKISGRVVYVVMRFGGFFGIRARAYPIRWKELRFDPRLGGYRIDLRAEQLRGRQVSYGDGEIWPERRHERDIHDNWDDPHWGL